MKRFQTQSQLCRVHLLAVLAAGVAGIAAISLLSWDFVRDVYMSDAKNILLNGAIVVVFASGVWKLLQAFAIYGFEEKQLAEFNSRMARSADAEEVFATISPGAIIARRYDEIKGLFERRVPIHHGALSAIMVAEQSLWSSFPRFVNNVLILTGVFGTIVSLIFALVGAGRTLGATVPTEGMAMMLSGMNTALTTTATAITCYFVYSYFYGRLTDIQTHLFNQIERAVLIHVIPNFAFDTDAVNHQTSQLIRQLQELIAEMQKGTGFIAETLSGINSHNAQNLEKLDALLLRHDNQIAGTGRVVERLEQLQDVLVEGFRLNPQR